MSPPPDRPAPRVVHILPETGAAGAERQTLYLLDALRDRPWRSELVYFRPGRLHDQFAALGLPLRQIRPRAPLSLDLLRRARELRRLYPEPPAIVHARLYEANLVAAAAIGSWPQTALVAMQLSGNAERRLLRVRAGGLLIRRRAHRVIANSQEGVAFLRERGYRANRMSLIASGIAHARFAQVNTREQARAVLGMDSQQPVVGFVGRPDQTKDIPTLLAAWALVRARVPEALLVMVGPSAAELARLAGPVPAGVRALGWVDDVVGVVPAFDVLAHSSWTEGNANAVNEALALGLPVASTATGDHTTLVTQTGGRVVPIRRPDLLADAIVALLDDPPEPPVVAAAARRELSMERVVAETEAVYTALLGDRAPSFAPASSAPAREALGR